MDESGTVLGSAEVVRSFLAGDVERREVHVGRVRGVLYLPPPHLRPAPAIITVHGGMNRGRVPEVQAAMFTSRGFASLALAFFGER